jgi:ACR3 family arsenite transporter
MLFGIVPCGGMVPAYTGMSQGNVGLSVSIAALSLAMSVGFVPLWTNLLLGKIIVVPFALTAITIAVTLLLPMLFAWFTRKVITRLKGKDGFQQAKSSLKAFSGFGLMLMGFSVFAANGRHLAKNPMLMIKIAAVTFFFLTILLVCSVLVGKLARIDYADLTALTISSTAKNNALSMSLAVLLFGPETALSIAVAGPMVQIPFMLGFIRISRLRTVLINRIQL